MAENTIQWDKDADGIVTLTLDDPTGSANVMNEHYKESMHNALRHARATRVELGMAMVDGMFEMGVADDGCGFDPSAAASSGRNGLRNLRARAAEAGGTVEIETSPHGTTVRVRLPLGTRVPAP